MDDNKKDLTESVKKIFLAGVGAANATKEKSKEFLEDLVKKGEQVVGQGKHILVDGIVTFVCMTAEIIVIGLLAGGREKQDQACEIHHSFHTLYHLMPIPTRNRYTLP